MTRIHHRTYHSRRTQYDRVRHCIEGQEAVRANAALYLRKPRGLTGDDWTDYLKGAHFYPVAEHTLRAMTGLCFRKMPRIEVPSRLEPMLRHASFDGNSIEVVAEELLREILAIGRVCALLDFPVNEGQLDALSTPHLSIFSAEDVYDWEMGLVNGVKRLTMLRLHEWNSDLEDTGTEQHLVLTLEPALTIRRYHVTQQKTATGTRAQEVQVGEDILPVVRGGPLFYIPAVIFGPYNLAPDTEKPPMLDLCDVSLAHWANSADLEHALHLSAMPTPVVTGTLNENQKPTAIGPGAMWLLPEGATAFFLTAPSDAHESLRKAILDKENRLAALGATMILSGQRRNEAEGTASMRYQQDTSTLQSAIAMLEAGLRTLLTWASEWVQPGTVIVEFNRDLISAQMDPSMVQALIKAVNSGAISRESFIDALRKGEIISRSTEEELDLIESEGGDLSSVIPLFQE